MPCCCSSITPARASAKPWQYALVISGWKDLGKYGCLAKGKRNESAHCGPKQHQPCAGLFRRQKGEDLLFRNTRGAPLTRDGVAYLLAKYVRLAAQHDSRASETSCHATCHAA